MPHYKDGTPATVGDTVRGKGYNIKDRETGELAEITGTLLYVNPAYQACNVQVLVVEIRDLAEERDIAVIDAVTAARNGGVQFLPGGRIATTRIEYGQADHFAKVIDPVALAEQLDLTLAPCSAEDTITTAFAELRGELAATQDIAAGVPYED